MRTMAHGRWRGRICNGLATEDELQPKLCDVPKESHFMRQRNVLVMATLPLLGLSLMVGSVGASGGGAVQGGGDGSTPAPLSTVSIPMPSNLGVYVVNRTAAIQLGQALIWDQQDGSNGTQACATCHFHAGADNRTQNQIN